MPLEFELLEILSLLSPAWKEILWITPPDSDSVHVLGVYFYSTFFTSIWVWLYALSGFLVKLLRRVFGGITFLKERVFNIEEKPLRSLGYVSVLIVTLIYIVTPLLLKVF